MEKKHYKSQFVNELRSQIEETSTKGVRIDRSVNFSLILLNAVTMNGRRAKHAENVG